MEWDELKLYSGDDIQITPQITVIQPTLRQIKDFGESRHFSAVHTLTSVGADLKWQLWDYHKIDYTQIDDYNLFLDYIANVVASKKNILKELSNNPEYEHEIERFSQEDLNDMTVNPLQLVLKDIDFADFKKYKLQKNDQIVLYDSERDITIDRAVYSQIVDAVRKIYGFKRNNQIPANERTKMDLIEDARDEAIAASKKPRKSVLKPLISALSVKSGQCGDERIWDMKIGMFFDNIKRISKIQDATLLLQGAYSGFASLKDVDKTRLDWMSDNN